MNASVDRFVKYLVMECEDAESTAFVDDLRTQAKAAIVGGKGKLGFLTSGSANGKSFTINEKLSADEVAYACLEAKRIYQDDAGSGPITFLDFSRA